MSSTPLFHSSHDAIHYCMMPSTPRPLTHAACSGSRGSKARPALSTVVRSASPRLLWRWSSSIAPPRALHLTNSCYTLPLIQLLLIFTSSHSYSSPHYSVYCPLRLLNFLIFLLRMPSWFFFMCNCFVCPPFILFKVMQLLGRLVILN